MNKKTNYYIYIMNKATLTLVFLFCYQLLSAQTTFTFIGNGNWSDALNWLNSTKPPTPILPNSIINIQPATGGQCIVDVPVTIPATATLNVTAGSQFVILGNLTVLSNNSYRTRLKKVWQIYGTAAGDTAAAITYWYDDQNRLIQTVDCEFRGSTLDTASREIAIYNYNGNDTLAYRRIRINRSYTDTSYYSFYPDGRKASDSVTYYQPSFGYSVQKFSYNGDSITLNTRSFSYGTLTQINTYIFQVKQNGNVSYQFDSSIRKPGGMADTATMQLQTTYLPNINPFYPAMRCCRQEHLGSELGMEREYTPKNLIENQHKITTYRPFRSTNISSTDAEENYTYVFRSDGYPLEANVTNIYHYPGQPDGISRYKITFEYD